MWKFKKEFAKNTIAFKGRLVSARNISDKLVEQIIKDAPSLAVNFENVASEEVVAKVEAPKVSKATSSGASKTVKK